MLTIEAHLWSTVEAVSWLGLARLRLEQAHLSLLMMVAAGWMSARLQRNASKLIGSYNGFEVLFTFIHLFTFIYKNCLFWYFMFYVLFV